MRLIVVRIATAFAVFYLVPLFAQDTDKPATTVPRLVRLTGTFHAANGLAVGTTESATLSIYKDEQGGQALWQETQNVSLDANGQYTAMLGITQKDGVPVDLFSSTEPRWLGVQFNRPGEMEQPRVQLVSVPYALKASDAETLGGKPASAYLLDPNALTNEPGSGTISPTSLPNPKALKPHSIVGTMNYVPYFTDSSNDLGNSVMYQSNSKIGIGTTSPTDKLDVEVDGGPSSGPVIGLKNTAGFGVGSLDFYTYPGQFIPSARWLAADVGNYTADQAFYTSSGGGPNAPLAARMIIKGQTGNVGIGTATPTDKLDLEVDGGPSSGPIIGLKNTAGFGIGSFDFYTYPNQTIPSARWQAADLGNFTADQIFYTSTGGGPNASLAQRMIIKGQSGGVGIGTATPASALDVAGDINMSGRLLYNGSAVLSVPGGSSNLAIGNGSMANNTTGVDNTAAGYQALYSNTTGIDNTAMGWSALFFNTTGFSNTASGLDTLYSNTIGNNNTANGFQALGHSTTGSSNTAAGSMALYLNTTGSNNIAMGFYAASNVLSGNSNNIHIGTQGAPADNAAVRIGGSTNLGDPATQTQFFASGIRGTTTGNNDAVPVVIDSAGQLGTVSSSRRYKEDIQDMGEASNGLMRLRPVTFRYQKPFADGSKPIQYGLIAEEVGEVYPDLVAHSADGQIETVKYQVLDSMLLNEVQRLNKENQALQERLSRLEAAMARMATGASQ